MSNITTQVPPSPEPGPAPEPRPWSFGSHPNFWWSILWCIALVLLTQVPGGVVAAAILVIWLLVVPDAPRDVQAILTHPVGQIAMGSAILVAHGLIILLSIAVLRIVAGRDWIRQVAWRLPSRQHVLLVIVLWPGFTVLAGGIYYVLRVVLKVPSVSDLGVGGMEEMQKSIGTWPLLIGVFLIGIMPALSEELWCRAFLGRGNVGTHGYILGILGTSFLFGLIHVDPCQGLMAAVLGIGLHLVYQWTRSLWMPMLLHFLNNGLAVVLTRFPRLAEIESTFTDMHLVLYSYSVLVVAAGLAALYTSRARLVAPQGELPWEPPYPGVACPPPDSTTKVEAPSVPPVCWLLLVIGLLGLTYAVWRIVGLEVGSN